MLWTKQIVLCTKQCAVYKMKETWAGRCPPRDQQREKKQKKTEIERVNKTSGFHFGVSYCECSPGNCVSANPYSFAGVLVLFFAHHILAFLRKNGRFLHVDKRLQAKR